MSYLLRVGPRTVLIDRTDFVIGSGPDASCRIVAPGVASNHACLMQTAEGMRIAPLDGRTLLNDQEISKPTFVSHAMTIKLGSVTLQLIDSEAAQREQLATQKLEAQSVIAALADAIDSVDAAIEAGSWIEAAERIRIASDNIGEDAASRRFLDPLSHRATMLGLATDDPRWIAWTLDVCGRHRHVPSSTVVDALVQLSRATGWRPEEIFDHFAKSVADSGPNAQVRLRRLLAG